MLYPNLALKSPSKVFFSEAIILEFPTYFNFNMERPLYRKKELK